jgi:hypothetical protein
MQHHTTHYAAYDRYWEQTTPRIVAWFEQYVRPVDVAVRTTLPDVAGETTQNLEAPL